ncbi:uncharacterized protein LOC112088485 [Eutrema salsugineum]|uniref:uncharacterized protein LOC112088485 n=1 Tax=Eutrema salsugineum TaxID=72664 RepID=UPI000CED65A2|nr:uncharacterized protein LOC112088485 [Eutrema salsugineum]
MWTVFGGQPMRFSLKEFGLISGLPCGEFPEDHDPDYEMRNDPKKPDPYWRELLGDDLKISCADIAAMIKGDPNMPDSRKLRLALILILDAVLISSQQTHCPTLKYVRMLEDLDKFYKFPWGRESFYKTITTLRPARKIMGKCEDPIGTFRQQLCQATYRVQGFPLILQLFTFNSISGLPSKLPIAYDDHTILDVTSVGFPQIPTLTLSDILDVETQEDLHVILYMEFDHQPEEGWGEWDDEVKDRKVAYMEDLISNGHLFPQDCWPGEDASLPQIVHKPYKQKKPLTRRTTASHAANAPADLEEQNQWLLVQVKDLLQRTAKLEAKLKNKTPFVGNRSSRRHLRSSTRIKNPSQRDKSTTPPERSLSPPSSQQPIIGLSDESNLPHWMTPEKNVSTPEKNGPDLWELEDMALHNDFDEWMSTKTSDKQNLPQKNDDQLTTPKEPVADSSDYVPVQMDHDSQDCLSPNITDPTLQDQPTSSNPKQIPLPKEPLIADQGMAVDHHDDERPSKKTEEFNHFV